MENNFLQWRNLKANGLIPVLFVMGLIIHFEKIANPFGVAIIIGAVILTFIQIVIKLDHEARKSKYDL